MRAAGSGDRAAAARACAAHDDSAGGQLARTAQAPLRADRPAEALAQRDMRRTSAMVSLGRSDYHPCWARPPGTHSATDDVGKSGLRGSRMAGSSRDRVAHAGSSLIRQTPSGGILRGFVAAAVTPCTIVPDPGPTQ